MQLHINTRQRCDLELLMNGGFFPLNGFLSKQDYDHVLSDYRLANNTFWPMPITLDVSEQFANGIDLGSEITLVDFDYTPLSKMTITDKWKPNKFFEAQSVFGTNDIAHPGVNYLLHQTGAWYLGGPITPLQLPKHYDFHELRHTPETLKSLFKKNGIKNIIAFQTRNPMHRAHMELTLRAATHDEDHILIHPTIGQTKPGDIDYFTRVKCYQKILPYYPPEKVSLSLLPLAMRMAGPREALFHAMIRKNYGCTHFIVGRDHAGPGNDQNNKPFYEPYAAQKLASHYQSDMGIKILPFQEMVYLEKQKKYFPINEVKSTDTVSKISGTQLRTMLANAESIPEWFSFPEVISELKNAYLPKHQLGFTVFFTGLSGAGKTTLANALAASLINRNKRNISCLDGDIFRNLFSKDLGFSKADRDLNIRRLSFIAGEITKVGGIVLCSAIAPFANIRAENRSLISRHGGYIEVYVSTPLNICERRDTKGLYTKARSGELKEFTGIDSPYEKPINPEIIINTEELSPEEAAAKIILFLEKEGYLEN